MIEVGYRAAAALRRSPHELLFEFSRGYVMRCGGEIVWFDEDPEAFSPRGVLLCRTGNPACPDRQDCLSYNDFFNNAVAQFLLTRNPQILLGLGHGLTPSGDDFLGGWHLVRHRLGHRETLDMSATHEISRARLQMHLNGEGTRAEIRFVDALLNGGDVENAAQILRNHGHSSGDDFMRGARAALQ